MILKVGADPFPPYQYYENGELLGTDYEMVNGIINKMGYNSEYILDDWSTIEEMLLDKKIDVAFQVQKTPERLEKYYFSDLFRNAITTLVSISNTVDSINEIVNKKLLVSVVSGYKYGDIIDSLPEGCKHYCNDQLDQLKSLIDQKSNFAVVDLGVFEYQLNLFEDVQFNMLRHLDFNRPLHVVFNDKGLRDEFNTAMSITK